MKKIGQLVSLLFVVSLLVFVIQNLDPVDLRFASWTWKMTLAAPVVAAYVLGSLTGRSIWRLMNSQRRQRKTDRKAQKAAEVALEEKHKQEVAAAAAAAAPNPK